MLISSIQVDAPTTPAPAVIEEKTATSSFGGSPYGARVTVDSPATHSEQSAMGRTITEEGADLRGTTLPEEAPRLGTTSMPKDLPAGYDLILSERNGLLHKKYGGGLSQSEARRLRFLQWQISAVEDSQMADDLQQLESLVLRIEQIADRVDESANKYQTSHPSAFRPRRRSK